LNEEKMNMAMEMQPFTAGMMLFLMVKLAGYGGVLGGWLRAPARTTVLATLTRVGIGLVAGTAILWMSARFGVPSPIAGALMLVAGAAAWSTVFRKFYPAEWALRKGQLMMVGMAVTIILNVLAWLGLFSQTGFIC
jgi:hypothetical protein